MGWQWYVIQPAELVPAGALVGVGVVQPNSRYGALDQVGVVASNTPQAGPQGAEVWTALWLYQTNDGIEIARRVSAIIAGPYRLFVTKDAPDGDYLRHVVPGVDHSQAFAASAGSATRAVSELAAETTEAVGGGLSEGLARGFGVSGWVITTALVVLVLGVVAILVLGARSRPFVRSERRAWKGAPLPRAKDPGDRLEKMGIPKEDAPDVGPPEVQPQLGVVNVEESARRKRARARLERIKAGKEKKEVAA